MRNDIKLQYERLIEQHGLAMKNNAMTVCEKLAFTEITEVQLKQEKNKTARSWCFRDWPCLFTQHRDKMDEKLELMVPEKKLLETSCQAYMANKLFLNDVTDKANGISIEAKKEIDTHLTRAEQIAANAKTDIGRCVDRAKKDAMGAPLPKP